MATHTHHPRPALAVPETSTAVPEPVLVAAGIAGEVVDTGSAVFAVPDTEPGVADTAAEAADVVVPDTGPADAEAESGSEAAFLGTEPVLAGVAVVHAGHSWGWGERWGHCRGYARVFCRGGLCRPCMRCRLSSWRLKFGVSNLNLEVVGLGSEV